jgi:UTP--glucose-1-phosphate uridylyltransferase
VEEGAEQKELQLTPHLDALAHRERYLALEVAGRRYDIAGRFGAVQAQIALALAGRDRDTVLATLVETIAEADDLVGRGTGGEA